MCVHQILLEDETKSVRQPQRRLNPLILDVVKNEIHIALEEQEKTTFICPMDTFTHRRMLFDPEIK